VNSPAVFAQLEEPILTPFCRREMDVRQLSDRVTKGVIHLPGRPVAAMDMGHDQPADVSGGRRRKGFDAISHHQHNLSTTQL